MRRALAALVLALTAGAAAAQAPNPPAGGWDDALKASQAAIGRSLADGGIDRLPMVASDGRRFTFADLRGKPVVVSFVYTGCFGVCPTATQSLAGAVRAARAALGPASFEVVSIGFNQPFDTLEAMGGFARQARVGDERWRFTSVRAEDVPALAAAFGFRYTPTAAGFDHLTQATLVDSRGTIRGQVYGETIEPPRFIGPLKQMIEGDASETLTVENVWTKIKLYCTVYDPTAGRYKLNYSLFVELFTGTTVLVALGWLMVREWRRGGRPA